MCSAENPARFTSGTRLHDPRYGTVWPLLNHAGGDSSLDIASVIVAAGGISPTHYHAKTTEYYLIHAGFGEILLGDQVVQIQPGDCITIPLNVRHAIRAHTDLAIWCITIPPYDPDDDYEVEPTPA